MNDPASPDSHIEEKWHLLSTLLGSSNPLFDRTSVLFGYDFSSNIYLIQGEYLTLVDAGNDYTAFIQFLDQGFKIPDIKKIALTHGHQDHVMGAVEIFRGYPGFKDRQLEIIIHGAGPEEFKRIARTLGCRITEVKGGETVELSGFDLEVIHTPGHTIDSLSFYHPATQTLFSGDTVLPHAMAEVDTAGGGRMDHYLYSLRTLLSRDIAHVLPGHGGVVVNIGKSVLEETYEGLIKRTVGPEVGWMEAAMILAQKGLLAEGLFCCHKELAVNPQNQRALEMQAFLLLDLARNNEAIVIFDKILRQDPRHFHALLGRGSALLGMGEYQASLEYFHQALEINPNDQETLMNKGMALYLSGRHDEAMDIEIFQKEFARRVKQELAGKGKE